MNHFCRQASRLTSDTFERPLRVSERIKLTVHLWMCASCRHSANSLHTLHAALKKMYHDDASMQLSESRKQEIIAHCKQKSDQL